MGGGWPDQARRENSRYSPSNLQASLDVWDTWNSLLWINRGGENTMNTILYHLIDQEFGRVGRRSGSQYRLDKASYNVPKITNPTRMPKDEFYMFLTPAGSLHKDREQCPCRRFKNKGICRFQANKKTKSHPKCRNS